MPPEPHAPRGVHPPHRHWAHRPGRWSARRLEPGDRPLSLPHARPSREGSGFESRPVGPSTRLGILTPPPSSHPFLPPASGKDGFFAFSHLATPSHRARP